MGNTLQTGNEEGWAERRHLEGGWWRGRGRGRPGPGRDPFAPEMAPPREPDRRPRGRQQNRGNFKHHEPRGPGGAVGTVQQLVMALSQTQSFSMSLLNLLEYHDLQPQEVRLTAANNGHLFRLQNEEVSLAPRLKLCAAHSSDNGCQDREACDSLHMCPNFVLGWCSDREGCVLGHRWHTDHNLAILRRLSMEHVRYRVLHELLRKGHGQKQGRGQHQDGPLDVCKEYNNTGCNQHTCLSLHVCLSFVVGLTNCTQDNCELNHNLLSPACCHLLKLHQLPVNETPRDVAMALLQANPRLKDQAGSARPAKPHPPKAAAQGQEKKGNKDKNAANKLQQSENKNQSPAKKERKGTSSSSTETETETESESESESDDSNGKGKKSHEVESSHASKAKSRESSKHDSMKKFKQSDTDSEDDADSHSDRGRGRDTEGKQLPKQKQKDTASPGTKHQGAPKPAPRNTTIRRTLWAHYLQGDVADPRICYFSVEAMCRDEANGCPKLHSIKHFHWQVKEQDGRWINLPPEQATSIERAFCDPANDSVALPRLDPSKLDHSTSGLLLLLGRDIWQADFLTSKLTNSTNSKMLQLRRLCTETIAGQAIKASTYHWYFLDINKKWVKYGNVDTTGHQNLVSSVTSTDIENHYQTTPKLPLVFKNLKFSYTLNFDSMTQTNQSTGVSRKVRRRPEPHLPKEDKTKEASGLDLPSHWDAMQPEERSRLVTLATDLDEYKKVVKLLGTSVPPTNIVQVDRIQNPFMWCALQNKIKELTVLYKNAASVNVQQLFHGTSHNVVASICNENFDWRLHGTAVGQMYGRGTYFGINAGTSYGYCRPGPNGYKYMFVARVAIGSVTSGNSSMARPPINPATSIPYESTADNVANPSMIIKYCKQEYYPEYLLTLK
uniref:Poly [ADP-ribose] polymerase n=1 Tax=Scylla olivacea TaxID=85551 RepID=A0A0P4W4C9_SCYOL